MLYLSKSPCKVALVDFVFMDFSHYAPHGYCIAWDPNLLWTFVAGNLLVAISYLTIPAGLLIVVRKRKDIKHRALVGLFAAFIFCCALTHLIKIWTFWYPHYWAEAIVDAITGVVSLITALVFFRLVPTLVKIPSAEKFEETSRKLTEIEKERLQLEMLHERSKGFEKIASSIPVPVWTCDNEGKCDFINERWLERTGSRLEDNLGYGWKAYIDERDSENTFKAWREAVESGADQFEYEFHLKIKDGTSRRYLSRGVRLEPDKSGANTIWFGCAVDVEDQRLSEEKLEQLVSQRTEEISALNEDLTLMNEELEQFNYVAAHDLREPLRVVRGFSDLLVEAASKDLDEESKEYLDFIDQAVDRMQVLIDSLLQLSRLGRGKVEFDVIEPRACIDIAMENLSMQEEGASEQVVVEAIPPVLGNQGQLIQLFQNLISNAIKFSDGANRSVVISSTTQDGNVIISVKDNGIGIAPEFKDKVFLPFQRLHSREEYDGSGIGLSIVKKIVDLHKGELWLESEIGEGTTVFVKLKAAEANS